MLLRHALIPLLLALAACHTLTDEEERAKEMYTETAESYYQLGDHERAIGQALKGLAIDPDDETLQLLLGWSLVRRGGTADVARAEQVFRPLADGDDLRARLGLAQALERQGLAHFEASVAIAAGKRVITDGDPTERAEELRTKSNELLEESREWYERALELQSTSLDALNGLSRVESLSGRPEQSLAWSEKLLTALAIDREYWEKSQKSSSVGERQEREVRRILQKTIDLEIAARLHAAQVLHDLGRDLEAERVLDAALPLAPSRADLYGARGLARKAQGKWPGAIEDIERYIALSNQGPDSAEMARAFALRDECLVASGAAPADAQAIPTGAQRP